MQLAATIRGTKYRFDSIKEVLAKANPPKSGDDQAGISARDPVERVAARAVLAELTLHDLRENPVVPYELDELTRLVEDTLHADAYQAIRSLTVGQFREWLLETSTTGPLIRSISRGLTPEMAAAASKLMSNMDLMIVGAKCEVVVRANNTLGLPGRLSARLQPNHPTDNVEGILFSTREGLSYGCGDAVIGVNPATESAESTAEILRALNGVTTRNNIPTQNCVLSHVTVQMDALRLGDVPMDLMFQSFSGSEKGNRAFGISVALMDEAYAMMSELRSSHGPNFMYFETGQGSALSSDAHHGADQVTLEARCYGFARRYKPFLVNTVVGFIGPEYLEDGAQITRAALEDHFMGKLLGLPMGCDACFTYHSAMGQNELECLKVLLGAAGCSYLMSLPVGDDIMLNYQSTSFHDIPSVRGLVQRRPTPEFDAWLHEMGIMDGLKPGPRFGDPGVIR
ncbi:MAG: ethanolamine ammonia-lyase [Deltaproteobacteria bacterium CG2_30_63_29]|nr:MAG: ethanolamine ammonia-lyase [Deltaproteobacteria bacterium CG2_30_63_29]PIW01412.1 MAG: ethanolamine ammonia lyase large subunit [Deltaproteobacteria bacterium CG17_big_fil_post_rev_8_21_14_2_50_63_7]PJB48221.1 MAG: ethanolamine ammonia lyase large subunit [Deltaproteobacteria bacterium CG_4_9_14_3_um_filter_63_12]